MRALKDWIAAAIYTAGIIITLAIDARSNRYGKDTEGPD